MSKLPTAFEQISSPIKLSELNHALSQFKEEMLSYLSQAESRMNSKITNSVIQFHSSKSECESSMISFKAKYDDIAQSIASVNVKFDHLTEYEKFAQKAKDKLTSHEIRINNLSKEINKACYKYDRIFIDNLLLPGIIGDCCKYKTTKDFFDDVISQLSALNNFKEKNSADLKNYKQRLESMMKSFSLQVDSLNKNSMRYTNDAVKDSEMRTVEFIREINERMLGLNIENSKYALDMKNLSKSMSEEMKSVMEIKETVAAQIESEISESKKANTLIQNLFFDFKGEFKSIKAKFEELAGFIKDVRFRKNLGVPIDKKEIATLLRNISFQKGKTFEETNDKASSNDDTKKKIRLKPINEGETDDGNIGEVSNNELNSDCPNKESAALNRFKQMKINPESPKNGHSFTENPLSPTCNPQKIIIVSPENYSNSRVNPFDLKKEQKMLGKKINIIEKRMLEFEIYARDKLNELFRAFTNFISITGINKSGLSLYGNLNVNSSRSSSSRNTNHNHKVKQEMNKEGDRYINVSNKAVSVSVVDLVQRHPFPTITNQYPPVINSVTKLVQKKITTSRGKSQREQVDKFVMQTLGSNPDENSSNNNKDNPNSSNVKEMTSIAGASREFGASRDTNRRGSIGNPALTPLIDIRIARKGKNKPLTASLIAEKRYPMDQTRINSYKWIPLQKINRKNPHRSDV